MISRSSIKTRFVSYLAFAFLLSFLPFLTHTVATSSADIPKQIEIMLDEKDNGRQIVLNDGQFLAIELEGNPSTGYMWQVSEIDSKILREVGEIEFEPESDLIGAPGKLVRRFEAVGAGQATLSLDYRRSWETVDPLDTFSIEVQGVGSFQNTNHLNMPIPKPQPKTSEITSTSDQSALDLPTNYNWCDLGGCTPVQNQGSCGSCWAFATAGVFEANIKIHDGITRDLAEQYLLSCNTHGWGCDGGGRAFSYFLDRIPPGEPDAGAVYEADFPYTAAEDPCNPPHPHHEKIISWDYVGGEYPSVAAIKQTIYDYGPVYVSICAGPSFQDYTSGVFTTDESSFCNGGTNHGVILTGWDDNQGSSGIWHLKNSWGPGWGESGHMRIAHGTSNVGRDPAYIVYSGSGTNVGPLVYNGHTIDDDNTGNSQGNSNGIVDCGEAIEVFTDLRNQGNATSEDVSARLTTSDPYVAFLFNQESSYADISGGGTGTNLDDYDIFVDAATPNGHTIHFDLEITASNGGPWYDNFDVPVTCPVDYDHWVYVPIVSKNLVTASGFNSQFNGSAPGWEPHSGTWWIDSDAWYTTDGISGSSASASYAADFGNFDYEASLWRSGCDTCANRLVVRGTPYPLSSSNHWYNEYTFQYDQDGTYSIWKQVAGGSATAIQGWADSPAINQGEAWNVLRVVADGANLYLYINGTLVWSGTDSSLSSGRVGIGMYRRTDSTGDQLWADWATLTPLSADFVADEESAEQQALNDLANQNKGGNIDYAPLND